MGIRFYCPNGHKVNVKEFQAGLKGICPVCGSKMDIPLKSTRPSSREEKAAARGNASAEAASPGEEAASQEVVQESPAAAPVPVSRASGAFASAPATFAESPASTAAAANDPFAQSGNVVWYVRPPSGGQFGPATTDIMRNWLAEGRVSADSLVWREGWREWLEAGSVFPQLASGAAAFNVADIAVPQPAVVPAVGHPSPIGHLGHHAKQHVPPRKMQLIALGALGGTIVLLLIIFILVLLLRH